LWKSGDSHKISCKHNCSKYKGEIILEIKADARRLILTKKHQLLDEEFASMKSNYNDMHNDQFSDTQTNDLNVESEPELKSEDNSLINNDEEPLDPMKYY
jgi:hypothetical protein